MKEIRKNLSNSVRQTIKNSLERVNNCSQSFIEFQDEFLFNKVLNEILVPVIFSLITVIGCIGNGLVIYVIVSRHQMRTSLNVLLFNLAVGDLCFLLFCVPLTAYHYASPNWFLGYNLCRIWNYPFFVAFYVNMYTLVLISMWRYLSVVHSTKIAGYQTGVITIGAAVTIWILMAVVNIPTLFVLEIKHATTPCQDYVYCGMADLNHTRILYLCFSIIGYIIPLIALVILNCTLLRYVKRHVFKKPNNCQTSAGDNATERAMKRTQRISRTIFLVIGAFCTSWLPLNIHMLYVNYGDTEVFSTRAYRVFRVVAHIMAYANSCVNPIIYHCTSADFRNHFTAVLPNCPKNDRNVAMKEIPIQTQVKLNGHGMKSIQASNV